jgi:hypothetical protein
MVVAQGWLQEEGANVRLRSGCRDDCAWVARVRGCEKKEPMIAEYGFHHKTPSLLYLWLMRTPLFLCVIRSTSIECTGETHIIHVGESTVYSIADSGTLKIVNGHRQLQP